MKLIFKKIQTEYPKFLLLSVFVLVILFNNLISLTPFLDRGFDGDDSKILTFYNILELKGLSFADRMSSIWTKDVNRLYSNQYIYIGFLHDLFGYNFQDYQAVGLLLKIIITLSLYPLILTLFKSRSLAFFATFFYSILPSSAGGLTFVITTVDYLGVIFMSLFGILYFKLIHSGKGLLATSLILLLTISSSYIRVFPLLGVIFLIELFLLIKSRLKYYQLQNFSFFVPNIIRVAAFITTLQVFFLGITGSGTEAPSITSTFFNPFTHGDWYFTLRPFYFLGYSLADNTIYNFLLGMSPSTSTYSLVGRLIISFSLLTTVLLWLVKPKRIIQSFLVVMGTSTILALGILMIAFQAQKITSPVISTYNPADLNASLFGAFYFVIGLFIFLEWFFYQRSNRTLLISFLSFFWVVLFGIYAWLAGVYIEDSSPISRYLVLPAVGACIFISTLLQLAFARLQESSNKDYKKVILVSIILAVGLIYIHNTSFIRNFFYEANDYNRSLTELDKIRSNFINSLANIDLKKPVLVYIEIPQNLGDKKQHINKFIDSARNFMLYNKQNQLTLGCRAIIYPDIPALKKLVSKSSNEIEFSYPAICLQEQNNPLGIKVSHAEIVTIFKKDQFYAFLFKEGNFLDIREQVLDKLGKD